MHVLVRCQAQHVQRNSRSDVEKTTPGIGVNSYYCTLYMSMHMHNPSDSRSQPADIVFRMYPNT
eukprot:m.783224 g.783224  ORF g.783224 m.783224 type:complete len:64 (+) comp23293_c0_seq6:154-345(+)